MSFVHTYRPLLLSVLVGAALGAGLGYFGQCTSGACPLTPTWWRGALFGGVIGFIFGASSKSEKPSNEPSEKPAALKPASPPVAETSEHPDAGK